jgi:hypothetical protein
MTNEQLEKANELTKEVGNIRDNYNRFICFTDNNSYQVSVIGSIYQHSLTDDQRKLLRGIIDTMMIQNIKELEAELEAL